MPVSEENPAYLHEQLITYIGNKRALLPFIGQGIQVVRNRLGRNTFDCLDVFSGSGIVSRYLKQFSKSITANDMELYAELISRCYLSNPSEKELNFLHGVYQKITEEAERTALENSSTGFISSLYAPADGEHVQTGERCFYTPYNARYLDAACAAIRKYVPFAEQCYFTAPLLSEASVHANTAGIFKGFYKNSKTGTGQFGGDGRNALNRICGKIELPFPVFSAFSCPYRIFRKEANELAQSAELYDGLSCGEFDVAYIDPPYNQHPYGSNYFMLNLVASYEQPDSEKISRVSGIPRGWNRSMYNRKKFAADTLRALSQSLRAKFLIVSFNSDGFISREEMSELLAETGKVTVLEYPYNTFRASRNLCEREIHVKEYLFVVEKN